MAPFLKGNCFLSQLQSWPHTKPQVHNALKLHYNLKKIQKSKLYSQLPVNYYEELALNVSVITEALQSVGGGGEGDDDGVFFFFFLFLKATERGVTLLF